ncbi:hypothetical protein DFR26_2099 [Paraperlucidibaca baekdonensis]|uniref:DUF2970 family protein n=1 Tax=Paraperlucidibaca baekdonensis TaxID=748120 RepID=A0A3E0H366_9GAMM|nr:hypothetical protein [Paraperlucidibaca baekdonensis]REH36958.1 hypothetical protein DFR26_2099 [Paraperlucidibaca baekdonensis]
MPNGYSNPAPPGGVKLKKRTRFRMAVSRILRSGFNVAGLKKTDLDENAEAAEIFVLTGILVTLLTIAAIWFGLQQFLEAMHQ